MTDTDRLLVAFHCSAIMESARRINELVQRSQELGQEVDVHLAELAKPVVWNGCGND